MEQWDIYNKDFEKTGVIRKREDNLQHGEYHYVVHIWIYNDNNEFLIQLRNKPLGKYSSIWACTGGAVTSGENGKEAAVRETIEEIGLKIDQKNLKLLQRQLKEDSYFEDLFLIKQNAEIENLIIDPIEVKALKWASKEKLLEMIKNEQFFNYGDDYFNLIFNETEY